MDARRGLAPRLHQVLRGISLYLGNDQVGLVTPSAFLTLHRSIQPVRSVASPLAELEQKSS